MIIQTINSFKRVHWYLNNLTHAQMIVLLKSDGGGGLFEIMGNKIRFYKNMT